MHRLALLRGYPKDAAFERVALMLAPEYQVECLVWDREGDYTPALNHPAVSCRRCCLPAGYHDLLTVLKIPLFNLWLLMQLLLRPAAAVYAFDLDTGLMGWLAARLTGARFIYHCLDPYFGALPVGWPPLLGRTVRRLETWLIGQADLYVLPDELRLPQHPGCRPRRVVAVPNTPHCDPLQLPAPPAHPAFMVGYLGSLTAGRSLPELIRAIGSLADEGVSLTIGGFGPLADELRQQSAGCQNVTFVDWLPYERVLEMERGFDLFVQVLDITRPTLYWGSASPTKLIESMACGRPILFGKGSLAAGRVEATGNGLLVSYGNEAELVEAIRWVRDHPDEAQVMGAAGRQAYEIDWRYEVVAERLRTSCRSLWAPGEVRC